MELKFVLGLIIFITSFYYIINEKIPGTWVSLLGGIFMVIAGVITKEQGIEAISNNLHIILLLVAMMIIVNIISETGFFQWVALKMAISVKVEPVKLLISFGLITGVLSAFLDNVTTVLLVIPVAMVLTKELELDETPYIILIIISSNIGGAATLIGDPPNLIIGSAGNLGFNSFFIHATPLALINLIATMGVFIFVFRKKLKVSKELRGKMMSIDINSVIKDKVSLKKALIVFGFVIVSFIFEGIHHKGLENVALLGALYLAIRMKKNPHDVFKELEWEMLFFLMGLFILIKGVEELRILDGLGDMIARVSGDDADLAAIMVLWISNISTLFIGSISHSVTFSHIIENMEAVYKNNVLWWALSYGACYGGIGTIIASACNLVGVNAAKQGGKIISAKEYMKYGLAVMVLTGVISSLYIILIF